MIWFDFFLSQGTQSQQDYMSLEKLKGPEYHGTIQRTPHLSLSLSLSLSIYLSIYLYVCVCVCVCGFSILVFK